DHNATLRVGATTTSREWFRPNPPLPEIKWGPRNSVNIGQSGVLFSLDHFAKNRKMYLENYWLKNKRSVEKGRSGPTYGWVIPANQRRKADAVDAVNELFRQGLEIHVADAATTLNGTKIEKGDFIVRGDQPYRTLADMYFSVQNFSPSNPRPYDDTGWTLQLMRNVVLNTVSDTGIFKAKMTRLTALAKAPGGISGSGNVVVVDHTTDNNLMTMRFRLKDVAMTAAEADFEVAGKKYRAGSFIIANGNVPAVRTVFEQLGVNGVAIAKVPDVKQHDLDIPRIGYIHSWQRTQDEGWVRAALDTYGIPYTYFADQKVKEGNLRAKYDVIIYPHVGGTAVSQVNGIAMTGKAPLPYKKTAETPNLGGIDESDDIRGGMGYEGLQELYKFVKAGGTLITEGATSTIFPSYNLTNGITVEDGGDLFARGSVMRGVVSDKTSPITYGYGTQVPVYFSQAPVLNAGGTGGGGLGGFGGAATNAAQQNTTPMATKVTISPWDWNAAEGTVAAGANGAARGGATAGAAGGAAAGRGQGGGGGGFGGGQAAAAASDRPRVVLSFPSNPDDMLLSGTLAGGEALANRAQVVDAPIGDGHVVMFAIRPFWRWQTHGTFFLGFNTILHWNDLKAK
ncbi:MAG: M14 family zinc carboxypeptidase, partial [Gemmatimonadaceae bacterium]